MLIKKSRSSSQKMSTVMFDGHNNTNNNNNNNNKQIKTKQNKRNCDAGVRVKFKSAHA